MILGPVIKDRKGEHVGVLDDARRAGFVRVRADGTVYDLADRIRLDSYKNHTIEVVVDRLITEGPAGSNGAEAERESSFTSTSRLADSVETALKLGGGIMLLAIDDEEERLYSEHLSCAHCGLSFGELAPRNFSFNSPHGACPDCTGLGVKMEIDAELVMPNKNLSLAEGAVIPWARTAATGHWYTRLLASVAKKHGFNVNTPVRELTQEQLNVVLYGDPGGVTVNFEGRDGHNHHWDTKYEGVISNMALGMQNIGIKPSSICTYYRAATVSKMTLAVRKCD
jgi:excinuclease ABC subunit A